MLKLGVYVPHTHLETVKEAMFAAGGGRIGNYDKCCWQCPGVGQFRPGPGADPHLGSAGALEQVEEFRVEMVCDDTVIASVVSAMKKGHPYEEPAYDVVKLLDY